MDLLASILFIEQKLNDGLGLSLEKSDTGERDVMERFRFRPMLAAIRLS